jgi:hypothetical protein
MVNPNTPYWFGCIPDCQMTPDQKCIQCNIDLGHLGTGPNSMVDGAKTVREAIQNAFDLGHKAAGGSIVPDVIGCGPWKFIEIAMDREEIDAVGRVVEAATHRAGGPVSHAALARFLEKISILRRKT